MNDDTKYWSNFYKKFEKIECSDFCNFVINYFNNNKKIVNVLDAGCGNGRDSFTLAKKYNVTGVDNCGVIIEDRKNFKFISDNFINITKNNYDLIYSRFTFHSITNEDHDDFLSSIKSNTYLAIEARSILDSEKEKIHGKTTHYRNYIEINYLKNLLNKYNFDILFIEENNNFAIYKGENPVCIRVICKKKIL